MGRIISPPRRSLRSISSSSFAPLNTTALPTSVDWSAKGAVTPIKNQEQCGSCWAFSTTGSVEGAWFLAKGELVSLSEQQLVDCSGPEGNQGCNGGLMDYAFEYIIKNKGITTEAAYPYTAADGTCQAAGKPVEATLSGYKDVSPNSETALLTAIAQQPVSVAVEADQSVFQFYSGGVMDSACGTALDHGVLAVGYGTDTGKDYYKVKNSWGADWGEKGYIRLGRGAKFNPSGQCGIQMDPSYPVV
jgi:C1A family cysteine protease